MAPVFVGTALLTHARMISERLTFTRQVLVQSVAVMMMHCCYICTSAAVTSLHVTTERECDVSSWLQRIYVVVVADSSRV